MIILVITVFLCTVVCQSTSETAFSATEKHPVTLRDFVVAYPTTDARHSLVHASRTWRRGMRTLIASNSPASHDLKSGSKSHGETWTVYPDDDPLRTVFWKGDSRAALVPFMAHKTFGSSYKWMLYGDDDTVWLMDSVLEYVADLDPTIPYFITDHLWFISEDQRNTHPNMAAPRCLPCNHPHDPGDAKMPFKAPRGCPCTPDLLCKADERGTFKNGRCEFPVCDDKRIGCGYGMHGGAGALMSIGLLQAIKFETFERCVLSNNSTGSDAFLTYCLWQSGFAITDPGRGLGKPPPGIQMFDPGASLFFGSLFQALEYNCDSECQSRLDNTLTLHINARGFPGFEAASEFVRSLTEVYDIYIRVRRREWAKNHKGEESRKRYRSMQ